MIKYFFTSLFLMLISTSFAQNFDVTNKVEEKSVTSYPIDGTHLLEAQNKEVSEYFKNNPEALTQQKLQKTQDWGFTVGTQKSFYADDFTNLSSPRYLTSFTCRAVGNHCYIFVEDSLWNTRVDQSAVDSIQKAFDLTTPANPNKGIYQMDVDAFGNPPDFDNDPRIVILILNIKDGWSGSGGYVAGYFYSYNEILSYNDSNKGEFYYIDANPLNLKSINGIQTAMSTTAHEFQHMINWNYHKPSSQLTFINESCSMLAELYCGYPADSQSRYGNETNYYLFGWRTSDNTLVLNDYSRAQKFSLYLWNQFGIDIFKYIVQSSSYNGIPLYDFSLQQIGQSLNFNDVFINWLIANSLNDTTTNRSYGYAYPDIYKSHSTTYYNPNVSGSNTLDNLGADYITFASGNDLKITFSKVNSSVVIKAIKIGSGTHEVVDVPLNSEFSVPDFGTTYSSVTFVIINTDPSIDRDYNFNSTGSLPNSAQELKWDTNEPTGYYVWSPNDTVAVQFDSYPGAKLDSISVALRRAGSITGGVWEFTGVSRPTPLGKQLAAPITASISTTTTVPYPIPYQNWTTVDLSSYSISTDKDFVVGFVIGSVPNTPGVMSTRIPSTGSYHSFTYLQVADGVSTPDWYYITSGTDTAAIYLMRAYVSLVTAIGTETVELLPKGFSLEQNYPNPFNPSTSINYKLAEREFVSLKVYDLLGNEVATLVNAEKPAGSYNVQFSMNNLQLSSGTYFYRLQAGNYVETKKMILLK